MTTQTQNVGRTVYDNLPSILAIFLIALTASNYFFVGGVAISLRATVFLAWTIPFAYFVSTTFLVLLYVRQIMRRERGWWYKQTTALILLFAMAILSVFLPLRQNDPYLVLFYWFFGQGVNAGVVLMCCISMIMGYMRVYVARTSLRALMLVIAIYVILGCTGVYNFFGSQLLVNLMDYFQGYWIGIVEYMAWAVYHIGQIALVTRVILLQERLRAG
ncbi:MAG: hypothetical protein QG670_1557 [Thermoproteota archaeon]|nr:hypothetical protein [Thermoproteota archaeon]